MWDVLFRKQAFLFILVDFIADLRNHPADTKTHVKQKQPWRQNKDKCLKCLHQYCEGGREAVCVQSEMKTFLGLTEHEAWGTSAGRYPSGSAGTKTSVRMMILAFITPLPPPLRPETLTTNLEPLMEFFRTTLSQPGRFICHKHSSSFSTTLPDQQTEARAGPDRGPKGGHRGRKGAIWDHRPRTGSGPVTAGSRMDHQHSSSSTAAWKTKESTCFNGLVKVQSRPYSHFSANMETLKQLWEEEPTQNHKGFTGSADCWTRSTLTARPGKSQEHKNASYLVPIWF